MKTRYRLKLMTALLGLASLGAMAAAPGSAASADRPVPSAATFTSLCGALSGMRPSTVAHVMFIVFENKSYRTIVGGTSTPYTNDTLIPGCGLATGFHNYSHPSTANYLAMTSGMAQGKAASADCLPSGCPQSQSSIFSQLGTSGRAWREYAEAMPSNCYKKNYNNTGFVNADGSTGEYYYVRHAPPPYYTSPPVPSECSSWDVPLGTTSSGNLLTALSPAADGLPAFSFVSPGGCDDTHDCKARVGDRWLQQWIPIIQRSAAYQSGQLVVFITYDEGTGSDKVNGETCWDTAHADSTAYPSCHIPTIVMSPYTAPGTVSGEYFNHLSLLGTAEDLLGLPRLPAAEGYTGLQAAFSL